MPAASTNATNQPTRARLLEVAVEVFAELGYRNATLREICHRAGANNAAINYHFRDKEHLYLEVIEHVIAEMLAHMPHGRVDRSAPPEEKLGSFIRSLLRDMLGAGPPTWIVKLLTHELLEPSRGLDLVVEKAIGPLLAELMSIVRELIGPAATDNQVFECAVSVFGQCVEYHRGRAILVLAGPYKVYEESVVEHLADHITQFSLAGIRAIGRSATTNSER